MPRYYFDIREGPRFLPDTGGEELEGLDAAKRHAAHLAGEITKGMSLNPASHVVIIEVCNEHKERVITVTVALSVERPNAKDQPVNPWSA